MADEHLALRRFVRGTLGCGCPDEVFLKIESSLLVAAPPGWRSMSRINIGGRLLLYIAPEVPAAILEKELANLLRSGVADRDTHGNNRLRLVVGCDDEEIRRRHWDEWLRSLLPEDDRVHLHLLPPTAIPTFASPRTSP